MANLVVQDAAANPERTDGKVRFAKTSRRARRINERYQ
jgi:hypothetical protein